MWHNTQQAFAEALADPARPIPPELIADGARFNVYRNNVAVGLNDALGETFPVVRALVGDDFFAGMAQVYRQKNRPASPVLSEYGHTFGAFIETFEPAQSVPYLSCIAKLERAWLDAYHAEDGASLDIQVLSAISESALDDVIITLHSSAHVLTFTGPAVSIWQAHQDTTQPDLSAIQMKPEQALIIRPAMGVHVIALSKPAFLFAEKLSHGETLGTVCEDLAKIEGFDPSEHLAQLFNCGAVSALRQNPTNQRNTFDEHR